MILTSFAPAAFAIAPAKEVEANTASCAKAGGGKFKINIPTSKPIHTVLLRPLKTFFNVCIVDLFCIRKQAAIIKDATIIMVELVGMSKRKER
jgi:hypothetical protein